MPVKHAPTRADVAARFSSIVESSNDAIFSKDTEGVIDAWNPGAERLFGYTADEIIGRHVSILVPEERRSEEDSIRRRIRRGEKVNHFETVSRRKDGGFVDISLTVSPVRNSDGEIIGASTIARDISDRRRAQEQQRLLLLEMNHRIKNLFTLAGTIVALSGRARGAPEDIIDDIQKRLNALARAHDLILTNPPDASAPEKQTTLRALTESLLSPYDCKQSRDGAFSIEGPDLAIKGASLTSFALLLHEFATNAVKYGALSSPSGHVEIKWRVEAGDLLLSWRERDGPPVRKPEGADGFGTALTDATIRGLGGRVSREWNPDGLRISLIIPRSQFESRAT